MENNKIHILIVDDDSTDGTSDLVKELAQRDQRIRLIRRVGRSGLASAIKEGLLNATEDIAAIMDSDGQHEPEDVIKAAEELKNKNLDLVAGSRFLAGSQIRGLSYRRTEGSSIANQCARFSLHKNFNQVRQYE